MNKVINIHLNGKSYHLEEAAYEALQTYLDDAKKKLAGDPDQHEILTDLEQAIAEKCAARLSGDKDVVTAAEMAAILEEMGSVEADGTDDKSQKASSSASRAGPQDRPKKLYRIPEGAMLAGVCNGLAAYFGADVTLVRLLVVALTLITGGSIIVVYIIMIIVLPKAITAAQMAEAKGRSLTAQEIVDGGKARIEEVADTIDQASGTKRVLYVILVILAALAAAVLLQHLIWW